MNLIRDYRLYESAVPNTDGHSLPGQIGKIYDYDAWDCLDITQRLLFLLRHRAFSLGNFHHLYLNFTPLLPHGIVKAAQRSSCREDNWLRYADVGCDPEQFNGWDLQNKRNFITEAFRKATLLFTQEQALVEECFDAVIRYGENLEIPYKEKVGNPYTVCVLVKINSEPDFIPVIRIFDADGHEIICRTLKAYGRDSFLHQFGSITIGKRSVRINPRKSFGASFFDLEPIKIEI